MRSRGGRRVTVELDLGVFGEVGIDGDDDPSPSDGDEPASEVPAIARVRRRRAAIAASLVVFLGLSAWGATTEIQARERRANLLPAPGAVLSLARPVSAAWTVDADTAHLPVFMPGLVVVQRGADLHGLDAGTGAERWQATVGESAICGTEQGGAMQGDAIVDPLVCFATQPDGRQLVTVIRTNGATVTRELDKDGARAAAATADGDLVTVRRIGPTPPPADVQVTGDASSGYSVKGSVAAGQDVVVRREDAQTGAPRWERTVTFVPVEDATTCGTIVVDSTGGTDVATFDVTQLAVSTPSSLVAVQGCGIQSVFTATGEPSGLAPPDRAAVISRLEPYVDGGVLRYDFTRDGQTQILLHPDGTTTRFADQVLQPLATDGTHPDVVLLATSSQSFRASDRAGSPRWQNTLPVSQVLARTGHVAVVMVTGYAIAGIDLDTGKTLWVDPASFLESTSTTTDRKPTATDLGSSATLSAAAAFTDGTSVTVALEDPNATTHGLITLDPQTGDVRWRALTPTSTSHWTQYYAVAGHVVSLTVVSQGPDLTPTSAITAWH